MRQQVLEGKMIGVRLDDNRSGKRIFRGKRILFYSMHSVEKRGDPLGRIVHDYGFYVKGSNSINAAHSCTSVIYNSTFEVASVLDGVK